MYDPDLEVVPLEYSNVLSVADLTFSLSLLNELYIGRGSEEYTQEIVNLFKTTKDNRVNPIQAVIAFQFEKISNILKWLVPICLLVVSVRLCIRERKL